MTKLNVAILATATLVLSACTKDNEEVPDPSPTTGTIGLSVTFMNGNLAYSLDSVLTDGAGHRVRLSDLKFYASDFHLVNDAAVTVGEFHEAVVLVDASNSSNSFTLGTMSPGHVHEAHIALGLDSVTNHADPTLADYPLNVPGMHWSWNPASGYKFLLMEGKVDGNGDGDFDDPEDLDIIYHCATDALLREAHLHIHANLVAGGTVTMAAKVDVAKVISGLDFLGTPVAMGGEAANITAMDSLAVAIDEM